MKQYLRYYFTNNLSEYIKLFVIFIIGIIISIIVINNSNNTEKKELKNFIDSKIEIIKTNEKNETNDTLKQSFKRNIKNFMIVVFLASTIIGIPFAYYLVGKKAFSIGYTISAIFATQSKNTAIIFISSAMIIQNIFYMISLFIVLVSGTNFIKAIIQKNKNNVKFEIFKYLIFIAIALVLLIVAVIFETYVSKKFLYIMKKYL